MKRARKYCREDGLTLVEIVLILVVTAIAVIPLSRLSITNIKTNAQQHVINRSMYYAEELIEWIVSDYKGDNFNGSQVVTQWTGYYDNPEGSIYRYVSINGPFTENSVDYWQIDVTVSVTDIPDVVLSVWVTD